jgi:hypothetical protein
MDQIELYRLKLDILVLARDASRGNNADNEASSGEIIKIANELYKFVTNQ